MNRKKLLQIKRNMLEDLQVSWGKSKEITMSDKKIYYYDGVVNTVLKYYKAFFNEDLCKSVRESEPFLDIEKVDDIAEEVIRELNLLK